MNASNAKTLSINRIAADDDSETIMDCLSGISVHRSTVTYDMPTNGIVGLNARIQNRYTHSFMGTYVEVSALSLN